jgi:hypothetical protein
MTKRMGAVLMLQCTCIAYVIASIMAYILAIAPAAAETTAQEAGPGATPKVIACMTACEQAQMACLQVPSGVPPERRTVKEINAFRACNQTEERCDHRCRRSK